MIFSESRIEKIQVFLPKILLQFQNENIDKNIKNPTSDAPDFVKLALLGASKSSLNSDQVIKNRLSTEHFAQTFHHRKPGESNQPVEID